MAGVAVVAVLVAAVLGGLAALAVFLYRVFRDAAQDAALPGAGSALVTIPAFLALLWLVGWMLIRFLTSGPANNRLTVTLREHGGDLTVTADGWRERRFPLPRHRASAELTVPFPQAGDPTLPQDQAQRGLRSLAHDTEPLQVNVDASLRLTATCWERVLGAWLDCLGPIQVHRVQRGGSTRRYHELTGRVVLAAPARWLPVLTESFGHRGNWTVTGLGQTTEPVRPGDIAVIVGAVVGERAGSRVVVPGRKGGDLLIEPDEIGDAAAVVVCGLPAAGVTDLADTARLRKCAADMVLGGCPTAVVLPSLPAELLGQVVDVLIEGLVPFGTAFPNQLGTRVQRVRELLSEHHPTVAVEVTELRAR